VWAQASHLHRQILSQRHLMDGHGSMAPGYAELHDLAHILLHACKLQPDMAVVLGISSHAL
jgi:hypothetical protein